jgi:hypothetical protein
MMKYIALILSSIKVVYSAPLSGSISSLHGVLTTDQQCGPATENTCAEGFCCSSWGYCGTDDSFCNVKKGCQAGFGLCKDHSVVVITSYTTTTTAASTATSTVSALPSQTASSSNNNSQQSQQPSTQQPSTQPSQQQPSTQQPSQQPQSDPVSQPVSRPEEQTPPTPPAGGTDGQLTWYEFNGGVGYCEGRNYPESALVVAVGGNARARCGSTVTISANGRSVTALVVDRCASCSATHLDATRGVWSALGIDLGVGVARIQFRY